MSRVDVIVPCYNYARFLGPCVQSVVTQEGVEVRVLILDDASTDETEEVGRRLAKEDSRVEYRRHDVNWGHIATYNDGLEWIGGDYCLLLSADDLLTAGALGRAARVMDDHPEVGLTFGDAHISDVVKPEAADQGGSYRWEVMPGDRFIEKCCKQGWNIVPTPTAVARTSVQQRIGRYRKELTHTGDMEMWLRFAAHSAVGEISAYQAYYRRHETNMSRGYQGIKELRQIKAAFDVLFHGYASRLPNLQTLRREAYYALLQHTRDLACFAGEQGNPALCRQARELALELDPSSRFRSWWWRLRCKQFIGSRGWSAIRPVYRMLIGAPAKAPIANGE